MMYVCHELSLLARLLEAARGDGGWGSSRGEGLGLDDGLNNNYYCLGVTVRAMTNFGFGLKAVALKEGGC